MSNTNHPNACWTKCPSPVTDSQQSHRQHPPEIVLSRHSETRSVSPFLDIRISDSTWKTLGFLLAAALTATPVLDLALEDEGELD